MADELKRGRPSTKDQVEDVINPAIEAMQEIAEHLKSEREAQKVFHAKPWRGPTAQQKETATLADVDSLCREATKDAEALGHELRPWEASVPVPNELPPKMPNPTTRGTACTHCNRHVLIKFCPPVANDPTRARNMHKLVTPHKAGAALTYPCDRIPQDVSKFSATRDPRILAG